MTGAVRDIYWTPWDDPGCEHLHLTLSDDGAQAHGFILRRWDGRHIRCRYQLDTDPEWRFRNLSIAVMPIDGAGGARLELESDGQGRWRADGEARPDLEGCIDVDIQVTPFTNVLPIRRLGLSEGEGSDQRMAYVSLPGLEVAVDEQRYTCLKRLGADGGRYRYEAIGDDFEAELPTDAEGLVMDYPTLFRRSWPR